MDHHGRFQVHGNKGALLDSETWMIVHLFPNFLEDEGDYALAERYWVDLWEGIVRGRREWRQPWFQPLPSSIGEGNPIFSAVSPSLRRGIRVIQSAPTETGLELVAYPDTFGGSASDPDAIHELVISCALSDVAAEVARSLMVPWVEGRAVAFDSTGAEPIAPTDRAFEIVNPERAVP